MIINKNIKKAEINKNNNIITKTITIIIIIIIKDNYNDNYNAIVVSKFIVRGGYKNFSN